MRNFEVGNFLYDLRIPLSAGLSSLEPELFMAGNATPGSEKNG
jgi:hypothetical protein